MSRGRSPRSISTARGGGGGRGHLRAHHRSHRSRGWPPGQALPSWHERTLGVDSDRRYDLAGSLLATAITEAERTGTPVADCLAAAARAGARVIGDEATAVTGPLTKRDDRRSAVLELLARHGYEPVAGNRGEIALVNCPFHRLADEHSSLGCGMNLDFLAVLLEGIGPADRLEARLAPEPGHCCVRIKAA